MTESQVFYSALLAVLVGSSLVLAIRTYRLVRVNRYRYRLYAVRDRLYLLVADGLISENDAVFKVISGMTNSLIASEDLFTPRRVFNGYLEAEAGTFDRPNGFLRFAKVVAESPPEVQAVVGEYFFTVLTIIRENSVLVEAWLLVRKYLKSQTIFAKRMLSWMPEPKQWRAYRQVDSHMTELTELKVAA